MKMGSWALWLLGHASIYCAAADGCRSSIPSETLPNESPLNIPNDEVPWLSSDGPPFCRVVP